jgi:hypothetical protein
MNRDKFVTLRFSIDRSIDMDTQIMTIFLLLLLLLFGCAFAMAKEDTTWKFLFLGQSNMVGYVESERLMTTLKLLHVSSEHQLDDEKNIRNQLIQHFQTAESSLPTPDSVYNFEASELIRLRRDGYLTKSFSKPLSSVTCSFYQLDINQNYSIPGTKGKILADDEKLSPNAHCGLDFGPELMFGHVLISKQNVGKTQSRRKQRIRIVKIAAGGSTIRKNWSKHQGSFWNTLVDYLVESNKPKNKATLGEYKAIVWFQGESDAFDLYQAQRYEGDLRDLISNLRKVLFELDTNTNFPSPSHIPVVIVGLGCWIASSPMGRLVMYIQNLVTSSTPNTILIPTNDLSCHYHYDDASQLIIGERIAKGLLNMTLLPPPLEPNSPSKRNRGKKISIST